MSTTQEVGEFKHNPAKKEFELKVDNGDKAFIAYNLYNKNEYDLYHTFVPDSQRGKGLAGILAKKSMDWIASQNAKALPSCSYLAKWVTTNPQYANYVIKAISKNKL
ncbi:hypothetical protein DLAC_08728 [Tieghemostelium lacteum]|uniref:N-acetyltransferase domain-containing protein n=1 Tax=Tieghemostelium lacteum TaxID=361077 RepID=A0A151Z860_TIELA|nr:hypothetical protein DLAC_08728 [Tieghemostelium lacteum]|eukprot:KYQ90140.1 hypothetical protein DLAC_08728 [Tieghemostelium lacteum]